MALVMAWPARAAGPAARPLLAIIDTGVCPSHITPDDGKLGEAFVLEKGWDYVAGELNYADEAGHGTHMSGIAWRQLQGLRAAADPPVEDEPALCMLRAGVERLDPDHLVGAVERLMRYHESGQPVAVVLCSFSLDRKSTDQATYESFRGKLVALLDAGVVVVSATRGSGDNLDTLGEDEEFLPGCLEHPNLLTIAACSDRGFPAPRASTGTRRVFASAVGRQVTSLWPRGNEKQLSGSSQAAALVAAEAYFLLTRPSDPVRPADLREALTERGTRNPSLLGRTATGCFFEPVAEEEKPDQ